MRLFACVLPCLLLLAATCSPAHAAEEQVKLKVGDPAPTFEGQTDGDELWKSKEYQGKHVFVFYFYPADLTGGCTKQACTYRDTMEQLTGVDVEVVGISGDTVENHQVFKKEHNLNFTLLADPEGKIAKAFGVKTSGGGSIEKVIQGEPLKLTRGITASRWTFVVDKDWKIAYVNMSVNPEKDPAEVLKVVEKLNSESGAAPSAVLQ